MAVALAIFALTYRLMVTPLVLRLVDEALALPAFSALVAVPSGSGGS